jgi:hypothetical protein
VAGDFNIQGRQREFGGDVSRGKQALFSASQLLVEPVKKPMKT